jgi:hypothetical protein
LLLQAANNIHKAHEKQNIFIGSKLLVLIQCFKIDIIKKAQHIVTLIFYKTLLCYSFRMIPNFMPMLYKFSE